MQRLTILEYKRYRYLKASLLLAVLAIVAYVFHHPAVGANGGTWLGYTLGIISAAIVGLMLWFGIRKRQYRGAGVLQGWLSAHIYLGTSLIVIATLHTGFQFGWNVHTLTYFLMMSVIANGFYGLYAYMRFPRMVTENLGEDNLDTLLLKIADLDELARLNALQLPDEINHIVHKARQETRIGGNIIEQLSGRQKDCPTSVAVRKLRELGKNLKGTQPKLHRELYSIMLRKETLVARARQDVMLKARLGVWLFLHVPLSFALVMALVAHIVSTFVYY